MLADEASDEVAPRPLGWVALLFPLVLPAVAIPPLPPCLNSRVHVDVIFHAGLGASTPEDGVHVNEGLR